MNFCSGCGTPITVGDKFCPGCGAPVVAAEKATSLVGASAAPVVYAGAPSEPAHIAPPPPPPVVPGGVPGMGLKTPSRKVLILAGSAVLLVVVVIVGGLVVRNIIRGGADSPEQAASKMIESVSNKDLVGAFLMVTPRERDAVQRVQEAVLKKYSDFGIADAVSAASGKGNASAKDGASSELSFEGIDLSVTGVHPRVTPISETLAAVKLNSGELRFSVDPAKTKGIVRAGLDASGTTSKIQHSFFIADLNNHTGLTLIAKKTEGRWYISPLLSGLEIAHDNGKLNVEGNNQRNGQGSDLVARGTVPAEVTKGAVSATSAASAVVSALPLLARDGVKAIAPYLESDEADALYLYGEGIRGLSGRLSDFTAGSATFTSGPQENDRAVAFVDRISFRAGPSSRQTTITATCLNEEGGSENICLNGSGYYGYSGGQLVWGADRGKFAVTTVKEDGGWKVSLLDTAADHAVSWLNSITREQALSYLGLERGDKTTGTITVGKQSTVAFNSAGYAVMKLVASQALKINVADGLRSMSIFDDSGREVESLGSFTEVKTGSYTVVMEADNQWSEAFRKEGNKVTFSAPILIQKYVEPTVEAPRIDGDGGGSATGSVSFANSGTNFVVQVPYGNNVELVFEITGVSGNIGHGHIDIDLDGTTVSSSVPLSQGATFTISLPADSTEHQVRVIAWELGDASALVKYKLEFMKK